MDSEGSSCYRWISAHSKLRCAGMLDDGIVGNDVRSGHKHICDIRIGGISVYYVCRG